MIIQICEKCDRFYMVHNPDGVLKRCPNCKNEDLENIYGDDAHIWYLERKLKVVGDQLALTEKALELMAKSVWSDGTSCMKFLDTGIQVNSQVEYLEYFKTKAKEIVKSE